MYLFVPLFGYMCDRYSPSPLALFSGLMFGLGYLLAAFAYKSGPPPDAGGSGWPFWVMVVAFVAIGMGTSCMYLAAVATCAKNYGRGKHKGIMLAIPIAAFGLSGMWQSQIGTYLLYERNADGSRGDVDVFRYFLFLAFLLLGIGLIGTFALHIVDDDEERYIDETVEELERSGLLEESQFFRPRSEVRAEVEYGTFASNADDEGSATLSEEEREEQRREKEREEEERRKKNWLLNYETRVFLQDPTMWWLAAGFFLVTGPGESYINNVWRWTSVIRLMILIKAARHDYPNSHPSIISSTGPSTGRPSVNARHDYCIDLNHRATPHGLIVGFFRTSSNPPFPSNPIRQPSLIHRPTGLPQPTHIIQDVVPTPLSPTPLTRLPPPRLPARNRTPTSLPRHHRISRFRLRQCILTNPDFDLRRLGRGELRHQLGRCCHDASPRRRTLGRRLFPSLPGCLGHHWLA